MKIPRRYQAIAIFVIAVICVGGFLRFKTQENPLRADALLSSSNTTATQKGSPRLPSSLPAAPGRTGVLPANPNSPAAQLAIQYFHDRLESLPTVGRLYRSVTDRLPSGRASELLAVYISEAIARNSSPEFAAFMQDLHEGLKDNSLDLYHLIQAQESELKQDPFIYQMTLNLAAHLELPGDLKAQLLGGALDIHFQTDEKTGISAMSTNITNAFILMKNYGISASEAAPYIQHGIAVNRDDPRALAEFAARANTYYPGSVTVQ